MSNLQSTLSTLYRLPLGVRSPLTIIALLAFVFIGTQGAMAERLLIPVSKQSNQAVKQVALPSNGTSMDEVLANFGEPLKVVDGVGEPLITRWEYANYHVYFENNLVLHSVVEHQYAIAN